MVSKPKSKPAKPAKPAKPDKATTKAAKQAGIAKAKAVAPDIAAPIGSTPATKFRGDPAIFGRLVEDHDRHRALLAMLSQTASGSPERDLLFTEFCREVKGHAAAEEQALWSTVLRKPETTEFGRHAVAEHHVLDEMMADLAARSQSTKQWQTRFEGLKEKYLHHIREEEQEQFVESEKHLTEKDQRHMRKVFNLRKKAEKTAAKLEKKRKVEAPV